MDLDKLMGIPARNTISRPIAQMHEFYLTGEIGPAEEYLEWFDTIRHSSETDIVKIYINSGGGNLFTAIQFLRVLTDCKATVIVSVEGMCASAATLIMLCADSYEISMHTVFMFHNYSGGTIGKGGEMYDNVVHNRAWSNKLLHDIYADFLTEDEIDKIMDNKDLWMDADEVLLRLNKRSEKFEADAAAEVESESKPEDDKSQLELDYGQILENDD